MEITLTGNKTATTRRLILTTLDILCEVGIPTGGTPRRLERMAMACMAVGGIRKSLREAQGADDGRFLTTREIINFENAHYGESISSGSYDDIRRKDLLLLVEGRVALNSSAFDPQATNNPTRGYALNPQFARLLQAHGTPAWVEALAAYKRQATQLADELQCKRDMERVPVTLPSGVRLTLSAGDHNVLQKRIVEDFLPRFGMGAEVLYIGDTADKFLHMDKAALADIRFFALKHEELPDVVAYCRQRNLLFLIEAVHSAGPMSEIRVRKLRGQLEGCTATPVFITAFLTRRDFRRWVADIAWETEVWLAESPEHMIHFNGYKFLEIHK